MRRGEREEAGGGAGGAALPQEGAGENRLYSTVREIIEKARAAVGRTVNTALVSAYWEIGRAIVENEQSGARRAAYGKGVLKRLSVRLAEEYGKGFAVSNLQYMRQFYLAFPNHHTPCGELSWSHWRRLMAVEDAGARSWYASECVASNWSVRELDRQIATQSYERLLASPRKEAPSAAASGRAVAGPAGPAEVLRDPMILEFLGIPEDVRIHETRLETVLLSHLSQFLLELGRGFCFVGRQKRMTYDDEDLYVDLVFYHSLLKCHVLIDLKVGRLTHKDVGQMDSYVRMFDERYRNPGDNPTIGLLLCSEKRDAVAKYSVLAEHRQVFASRYLLALPDPEVLQRCIRSERERYEERRLLAAPGAETRTPLG